MNIIIIYKNINKFSIIFSVQLVYKSIQEKNLFSPYILSTFVLFGFTAISIILTVNVANGFFHDKPPKPQVGIVTNPDIIAKFDTLYTKYPNISQEDVNRVHADASVVCLTGADAESTENDSPFAEAMTFALCKGFMTGMMENYLDALGIAYYSTENNMPPVLAN